MSFISPRPGVSFTGVRLLLHRALAESSLAAAESPEPPAFPCPRAHRVQFPSKCAKQPALHPALQSCFPGMLNGNAGSARPQEETL